MKKNWIFFVFFSLFFLLGFYILNVNAEETTNKLILNGAKNIVIEFGVGYTDPKATFITSTSEYYLVEPNVTITETTSIGSYEIKYEYTNENQEKFIEKRNVKVVENINDISNLSINNVILKNFNNNSLSNIIKTSDDGFIVYDNTYFMKYNKDYNQIWKRIIGNEIIHSYVVENDNSIIGVGQVGDQAVIIKFDSVGNKVFSYNFGNNYIKDYFYDVIKTSDNNYVVVGEMNYKGVIIKFDDEGNVLWEKSVEILDSNHLIHVVETYDDNYLAVGNKYNNGYVVKFSSDGNLLWTKLNNDTSSIFKSLITTSSNDFVVGGSINNKASLIKYDLDGNRLDDIFISEYINSAFNDFIKNDNGEIIIVGNVYNSSNNILNGYIAKVDKNLNLLVEQVNTSYQMGVYNKIIENKDNEYYVVGSSSSLFSIISDNGTPSLKFHIEKYINNVNVNTEFNILEVENPDNVDYDFVVVNEPNFLNNIGTHDIIFKLAFNNNEYYFKRLINVVDTEKPIIVNTKDFILEAGSIKPDWLAGVEALDNYTKNLEINVYDANVNLTKTGTYNLTYYTSDENGNIATAIAKVTIVDTISPIIDSLDEITVEASLIEIRWEDYINITDNSSDNLKIVASGDNFYSYNVGEYQITLLVTDKSSNSTQKNLKVTVIDTTAPTISLKKYLIIEISDTKPIWDDYFLLSDNTNDDLIINIDDSKILYNEVGSYNLEYSIIDANNNATTENYVVNFVDTTLPVIEVLKEWKFDLYDSKPDWSTGVKISDNSNKNVTLIIDDSKVKLNKAGKYDLKYIATDESGNTFETIVKVRVVIPYNMQLIILGITLGFIFVSFGSLIFIIKKLDGKYN